jgi:hypothetical protein
MSRFSERLRSSAPMLLVVAPTALLHTVAFPFALVGGKILCVPEAAYILLVPLTVWLMRPRTGKQVFWVTLAAFWLS